jgi:hypothetical protein
MQHLKWHLPLIAGAFLAFGGSALASPSNFCQTGTTTSEQQRIDCAGRWVSADGTRFGPRFDPRDTPKTAHPGYRTHVSASAHSTAYTTRAGHAPANVWTPPEPYGDPAAPVVVTRGNHGEGYASNYDIYVPTRAPFAPPPPPAYRLPGNCGSRADLNSSSSNVICGNAGYRAPPQGCFTLSASGQPRPVPCPVEDGRTYSNTTHSPAPVAMAHASASATASVNISSSVFFNSLSGGVGGSVPIYYGGGGGGFISGGGGSVLSRAPLLRMGRRSSGRHGGHGGGGGCGCGGGGMNMGGGGGD